MSNMLPNTLHLSSSAQVLWSDCRSLLSSKGQRSIQAQAFNGHKECYDHRNGAIATQGAKNVDLTCKNFTLHKCVGFLRSKCLPLLTPSEHWAQRQFCKKLKSLYRVVSTLDICQTITMRETLWFAPSPLKTLWSGRSERGLCFHCKSYPTIKPFSRKT